MVHSALNQLPSFAPSHEEKSCANSTEVDSKAHRRSNAIFTWEGSSGSRVLPEMVAKSPALRNCVSGVICANQNKLKQNQKNQSDVMWQHCFLWPRAGLWL